MTLFASPRMARRELALTNLSLNGPLLCDVCRSPKAAGVDFASTTAIDRLLNNNLSQLQ
jgi:hypothetical protein